MIQPVLSVTSWPLSLSIFETTDPVFTLLLQIHFLQPNLKILFAKKQICQSDPLQNI